MPLRRASDLGRRVFAAGAFALGLVTLAWPEYDEWLRPRSVISAQDWRLVVYAVAAVQIFGGVALQFRRSTQAGGVALGAVYAIFASLCVPRIVSAPHVYDRWGNFFEQFSLFTGAVVACACSSPVLERETLSRIGRTFLGACVASCAVEQAVHLDVTASLVPNWLPPGRTFWAAATTALFALAAVALLTNRYAVLTARLLATMLALFCLLVWMPLLVSDPRSQTNWGETAETLAIAGTAWLIADLLTTSRSSAKVKC